MIDFISFGIVLVRLSIDTYRNYNSKPYCPSLIINILVVPCPHLNIVNKAFSVDFHDIILITYFIYYFATQNSNINYPTPSSISSPTAIVNSLTFFLDFTKQKCFKGTGFNFCSVQSPFCTYHFGPTAHCTLRKPWINITTLYAQVA